MTELSYADIFLFARGLYDTSCVDSGRAAIGYDELNGSAFAKGSSNANESIVEARGRVAPCYLFPRAVATGLVAAILSAGSADGSVTEVYVFAVGLVHDEVEVIAEVPKKGNSQLTATAEA